MDGSGKRSRPKARQSLAHIPSHAAGADFDKQNATVDLSALTRKQDAQSEKSKKKTRGKSLGPGGLEALQDTTANVMKDATLSQIKSILKPTVPLTPPKTIPSFDELRKQNANKTSLSNKQSASEDLLIDFSTPAPNRDGAPGTSVGGAETLIDPFSPVKTGILHANLSNSAEGERREEEKRQAEKKAILERRAARRKSLANRRVSFAPEATLHTWSVMELVEDSTTSSATNSTRRQSSITAAQSPAPKQDSDPVEPPSTPPEQVEEPLVKASPAHQRDLHQGERRRSSSMSADMDMSESEIYSSSPSGDLTTDSSPARIEDSIDSESDTDGDTAMSIDITSHTVTSHDSTHSSLDERLRQAATLAGTRGIEYDENGEDLSMEIADGTVTNAFQPWVKNQQPQNRGLVIDDQENVDRLGSARPEHAAAAADNDDDETQGVTMDITRAIGGIVIANASPTKSRRKSSSRQRNSIARRQSTGADSSYGDESMDITTIAGGILSGDDNQNRGTEDSEAGSDAEMTMEFTTAVGGLLNKRRESVQSMASDGNETMDMTAAVGGILASIAEQTEPQTDYEDDKTAAMDMTRAVGKILEHQQSSPHEQDDRSESVKSTIEYPSINLTEDENSHKTDFEPATQQLTSIASETGSPSLALKPRPSTRSTRSVSRVTTPRSTIATPTKASSNKKQTTPLKQMTPVPVKAKTPERTPLSSNVAHRGASPRKLFQAEIKARASPGSARRSPRQKKDMLFSQDMETGRQTPRVVLHAPKPHQHLRRRSSGVGIDTEGFGSPKVSELLDRRASIGDSASGFKLEGPQKTRIRFEDPRQIEHEIDTERAEDQRRESGRLAMSREVNERQEENTTLQLKELIDSMTPKKSTVNRMKGRKSLAVGSARGLLGKRPAELDGEEEDGDTTPKRLKAVSREGSPVKAIHLPKPPSKEETTGRLTRAQQLALDVQNGSHTPEFGLSPQKQTTASSPQPVGRFRDVSSNTSERPTSFEDKLDNVVGAIDAAIIRSDTRSLPKEEDKISLQDFLNMTNIHFIELSTTKRRHTMAQSMAAQPSQLGSQDQNSLDATFVAASTTLPLLELYQHATRELKSYISTGRKIIKTIETETFDDQPALFREYLEARPDVKVVMDNQFRNGKTNARLQSKEGWYTWRSQLVDGLSGGLQGIKADLQKDLTVLSKQQDSLNQVIPKLNNKRQRLEQELVSLTARLAELDSIDHEALKARRNEFQSAERTFQERSTHLQELKEQMTEKDEVLSQAAELKTEMHDQIVEAERVEEEYRGWPAKDVVALKSKVDIITKQTGWSLIAAEEEANDHNEFGVALILIYKDELRLFFYPAAFQHTTTTGRRRSGRNSRSVSGPTAPISLTRNKPDDGSAIELPTEQRFFLQLIQSQLQALSMAPKGTVSVRTILDVISNGWNIAQKASEELRLLNFAGVCTMAIQSDESLCAKVVLLTKEKSRVDIEFALNATILDDGKFSVSTSVKASAIYGTVTKILDASKSKKVQNALTKEVESIEMGEGAWVGAVHAFEQWYQAQSQPKIVAPEPTGAAAATAVPQSPGASTPPTIHRSPVKRSPLAAKKSSVIQKKALPVPTSRTNVVKPLSRETLPAQVRAQQPTLLQEEQGKENILPAGFVYGDGGSKPAITPEMQEAMMHNTPIKRVGALRRSPIGGA